ncbi:MAG: hypothetical protein IJS62_02030 [Bacteroidales bacterium]|nr:hypothetical protein [Bacteroidales bacterium]
MKKSLLTLIFPLVLSCMATAGKKPVFKAETLPAAEGLKTELNISPLPASKDFGKGTKVWHIDLTAVNRSSASCTFKLVLSAEPGIKASRYLIPGVLYNGNEFVGDFILSDGRAFSTAMPNGWEKDGQPWIFAGDRSSIPACSISEDRSSAFGLFASDADLNSITGSSSLEKLPDGSFRHLIYWPMTEAPVSYTDKRKFTGPYHHYITLAPGESYRVTAYACMGRPKWENYGFTAVFPVAWKLLDHETRAQRTIDETVRLDRSFMDWTRRRNDEGSWFGGGHDEKMFTMGYMNIPRSKEGYTLEDYEKDFTLNRWKNDDIEKAKRLAPGEYLFGPGTINIGFASQSFQRARLTLEYALKDGDAEGVRFGCEVLRSWIRVRQQESGFFRRGSKPVPGKTFTDASEVGWSIGELARTVMFLREHKAEIQALGIDAEAYSDEFAQSAARVVKALLAVLPGDGGLGSQWDFITGKMINSAGDCGGYVLMGLVRYWKLGRDPEVRKAIDRAFHYYYGRDIDRFECNGGAMDCSSVDREGIQPFLSAAVEMWKMTGEHKYLEYARKAGWYFLSWVYLQNPVYGPDLDLSVYNWRPAGATIVGTEHAALDDYGNLLISELFTLSEVDGDDMWKEVAALMWRNGTQGFADENRNIWHALERPVGSKNEAWFQTRWSKYRTGENKRGSLNDHLMTWGGTYRLASLLELSGQDIAWLESVSQPATQVVLSNACGTARVDLRGANMRSWKPVGKPEVLGNPGIPIYWPWAIYEGRQGCEIHGLTPYFDWTLASLTEEKAVFVLEDSESSRRVWPHKFHAEMEYRLGETLTAEFRVTNTDDHPYSCTELLHPFFRVSHPTNCRIEGLSGSRYFWKYEAEKGHDRIWEGDFPVQLISGGKPGIVFNCGEGKYTLVDGERRVSAAFTGGIKFVAYVAPEGAVAMETGTIYRDRAYTLRPGETHKVSVTLSLD